MNENYIVLIQWSGGTEKDKCGWKQPVFSAYEIRLNLEQNQGWTSN